MVPLCTADAELWCCHRAALPCFHAQAPLPLLLRSVWGIRATPRTVIPCHYTLKGQTLIAPSPSQIFGKGAKFSMFKPAEEMVYIGLDEESRTKGKAAIDVVGAQSGKSLGSILQQALLLATGGAVAGARRAVGVGCDLGFSFRALFRVQAARSCAVIEAKTAERRFHAGHCGPEIP